MAARAFIALSGNGMANRDFFRSVFEYHRGQTMRFSRDVGNPGNRTRQWLYQSGLIAAVGISARRSRLRRNVRDARSNSNFFYASPEIMQVKEFFWRTQWFAISSTWRL